MRKHLVISALLAASVSESSAQPRPVKDTLPKADTALSEIKDDIRDHLPTIMISDDDFEESGSAAVSSILTAGRDPFLSAAEFNFSALRFRLRGYDNHGNALFINGINFNGLDNGFTPFGLWSGLNNAMRAQQNVYGLQPNDYSMGAIALNSFVDMRAGAQRAQTQIGYAISNRNYTHRLILQTASGFNKKGWAYSFALTGRYADEGYVPGSFYRSASYYAAVDKKVGTAHTFSLITFGAPTQAGRQAASVQETMDLVGSSFYNPSWGYQNGKKRNANVLQTFQPVVMAVHSYQPSEKSNLMTTWAYVSGNRKNTALDWYNAPDPRPDYYRYLPSYYEHTNPAIYQSLQSHYLQHPEDLQINWNQLYEANRSNFRTIMNADGIAGNLVSGNRSVYILSNRVNHLQRIMGNMVYQNKLTRSLRLTAGLRYQQQQNQYYQEVNDLLGGDFWVNINQFAERDFPADETAVQYDLNQPNRIIATGEQYGHNYKVTTTQAAVWTQFLLQLKSIDVFAAAEWATTNFYRTGLNRNGLFPEKSYGKSPRHHFNNPNIKAGLTYKMNGRNYFFVNGAYAIQPPFFENAYVSLRTRNTVQEGLTGERIMSAEAGYKLNSPRVRLGITGYYTQFANGMDVLTFYHDQFQNFVNLALSGIHKVFFGGELGIEAKLSSTLSFNGAAAIGRYYFDSRQQALVTVDNSAEAIAKQTIFLKNYRIPSTPQNAYSAGWFYRSPKFWYASITGNYFTNMWLSPNPLRRTAAAIADTDPENPSDDAVKQAIIQQQQFDHQFTLDFFGGWSKLLPKTYYINGKRTYLIFNLGVNNILNNQGIRSGGFEQLRFDFEEKNVNKFPPKNYYAYGVNYFASIGLRF